MNLSKLVSPARTLAFRAWRSVTVRVPGGRIEAFGGGARQITAILVINLDRQPGRWRRVTEELGRFRTADGKPLTAITRRLVAVDARDGRSSAATGDVDVMYRVGDQMHVQPDPRLAECFSPDEPVRMTHQEVAVARSHVEAWKSIASGAEEFVLVLEDDAWFKPGARSAIDRGWRAALSRCAVVGGPRLLYLSYDDAGGTGVREDACDSLFRPVRGLWFLSGYVLSRAGANALLHAMPVVGPVDLWMNYRLSELGALAISSPAIAQRPDAASDNAYSMLPFLARAGIVDAAHGAKPPDLRHGRPVFAWSSRRDREGLAMALAMLGLRVRVFDGDEAPMHQQELMEVLKEFDALVDVPLLPDALTFVAAEDTFVIFLEADATRPAGLRPAEMQSSKTAILEHDDDGRWSWGALCRVLGLVAPVDEFPAGAPRALRMFRDDRPTKCVPLGVRSHRTGLPMDDSPWILPSISGWQPLQAANPQAPVLAGAPIAEASMAEASSEFPAVVETFPGNLAAFALENLEHSDHGARLRIEAIEQGVRPYRSAAFASRRSFEHGLFQAEIRAAAGSGLITGFFLHRHGPLQEIDIEIPGSDPRRILVNVYFNPGDEGAAMSFGYRGTPCWIDLGFDASAAFHLYAIDWRPDRVAWLVDGRVVHERVGWDPTPIPHLKMRLHANLWAPRSEEFAGRIDDRRLPASAAFRNVSVKA